MPSSRPSWASKTEVTAERVRLGPDGPEISRAVFGCWRLAGDPAGTSPAVIRAKIDACLEAGVTTFDHADIYGGYACEALFGTALKEAPGLRDRIELVTKCGIALVNPARPGNRLKHYDYSRARIVASVERSLENLATETIDVLLFHRPSPLMDPDEMAEAADRLRRDGKVRHFGVSNFTPAQERMFEGKLALVTNQIELNPLRPEPFLDGSLDRRIETGTPPMAWSPLGGGRLLTGDDPVAVRVRTALEDVGQKYGIGPDQTAYAWLAAHPAKICVVLGTNRIERIAPAVAALDVTLDVQDWFEIWTAATGEDVP